MVFRNEGDEMFLYFFRQRVKEIMRERNLSQREVARKAGLKASNLSSYLSGTHEPGLLMIKKIADALSVSPALFFCEKTEYINTSLPCWKGKEDYWGKF